MDERSAFYTFIFSTTGKQDPKLKMKMCHHRNKTYSRKGTLKNKVGKVSYCKITHMFSEYLTAGFTLNEKNADFCITHGTCPREEVPVKIKST